mmetsp:Transcript_26512/g.85765  ORF Transcript_26512/g.85765 Transcript_26512/m.85765 type:complete len:214 (+) Transcript_26512:356-997(+)
MPPRRLFRRRRLPRPRPRPRGCPPRRAKRLPRPPSKPPPRVIPRRGRGRRRGPGPAARRPKRAGRSTRAPAPPPVARPPRGNPASCQHPRGGPPPSSGAAAPRRAPSARRTPRGPTLTHPPAASQDPPRPRAIQGPSPHARRAPEMERRGRARWIQMRRTPACALHTSPESCEALQVASPQTRCWPCRHPFGPMHQSQNARADTRAVAKLAPR